MCSFATEETDPANPLVPSNGGSEPVIDLTASADNFSFEDMINENRDLGLQFLHLTLMVSPNLLSWILKQSPGPTTIWRGTQMLTWQSGTLP